MLTSALDAGGLPVGDMMWWDVPAHGRGRSVAVREAGLAESNCYESPWDDRAAGRFRTGVSSSASPTPSPAALLRRLRMHHADDAHVGGCAEAHHGKARNWRPEGAIDGAAPPDLSDVETPRSDDGDRPHGGVDDDLDLPVIELSFVQINGHGAHARVDLGKAAHLPAARESNLAHRRGYLERLLTPPRGRREFDRGRQASKHGGDVGMGTGAEQPIEGCLKAVEIHLAAGQEPLQCIDPACRRSSEIGGSVSTGSLSSLTPAHYRPMRALPQAPGACGLAVHR